MNRYSPLDQESLRRVEAVPASARAIQSVSLEGLAQRPRTLPRPGRRFPGESRSLFAPPPSAPADRPRRLYGGERAGVSVRPDQSMVRTIASRPPEALAAE